MVWVLTHTSKNPGTFHFSVLTCLFVDLQFVILVMLRLPCVCLRQEDGGAGSR